MSVHKLLIVLLCLAAVSGCYRQSSPEGDPNASSQPLNQLQGINALILSYQTPEQRQALQDTLSGLAIEARLKRSAGGQAEFELSLDEAGLLRLQNALKANYRIERQGNRLYLVCCL